VWPGAKETIVVTMLSRTRRGVPAILAAAGLAGTVLTAAAAPAAAAPATGLAAAAAAPGVFGWGQNGHGELGTGTTAEQDTPVPVSVSQVAVQQLVTSTLTDYSAALLADGEVATWGSNDDSQLGDGTTHSRPAPATVAGLLNITQISGGFGHMLAVDRNGRVWSWGDNEMGELGDGTSSDIHGSNPTPVPVPDLTGITQVAAGSEYSLALAADGTVWAWGGNSTGQLGDGTKLGKFNPEKVPGLTGITEIASSGFTSYAVGAGGTVRAWGSNDDGLLGNGTSGGFSLTPAPVPGLTGITQISSSPDETLALAGASGTVRAWGDNNAGELGDGTTTSHYAPEQLGLTGVTQVSAGWDAGAAVLASGTLLTWGQNSVGELGLGTHDAASHPSPGPVPSLAGVTQVSLGIGFGLAVGQAAPKVPDVRSDIPAQASAALQAAGFVLGRVSSIVDLSCDNIGTVISQSPAGGTLARPGSAVSVAIGKAPGKPCP
jgi:alpha-tubulin suppressor-like RCC1 family protein